MKTKALITGVTGMVGSHLTDFLLEKTDWEIYGVCRWRSPLDNVGHLLELVNKEMENERQKGTVLPLGNE